MFRLSSDLIYLLRFVFCIFARVLRLFAGILQFPSWQGTCHHQKKYEKNKKHTFCNSELAGPWGIPTQKQSQTHNTVDPRGTLGERQGMMCKPDHSQSSKGSKLRVKCTKRSKFKKTLESTPEPPIFNFSIFCNNARIAIVFKFQWRKRIQVYIYIYIQTYTDV